MICAILALAFASLLAACASPQGQPSNTPNYQNTRSSSIDLGSGISILNRNGSSYLTLSGRIDHGDQQIVRQALAMYPVDGFLLTDSGGGYVVPAQEIGYLLRHRGMTTLVTGYCASACVDIFVAGRHRVADVNARLGIHAPTFVNADALNADSYYYETMGVPQMLDATYSVPNNDMFWFNGTEAVRYGLAHQAL